ncbi:LytR/AlgR family response regulator transcription factor [Saccharicrinis sp. FJH54]|uniref:LytR/AlgR family response regulator transcription factor n=1 Tax=Saccharicrinis sp. FJH54 TaxID=3344665 RepID=UPI0035D483B4
MMKIVIIDDEPKARETIRNILALSSDSLTIAGEAGDMDSAYQLIKSRQPDLVLLDINLSDGSGFDLLKRFEKTDFKVIFITAHEEYAVKAFKYSALDYILKPVMASEVLDAVRKAGETLHTEEHSLKLSALLQNLGKLKKIVLKTAESIHIVNVPQIIRCEADVNYTVFHLAGPQKLLVSKPLKEYDELLSQAGFFRAHQSHLVNMEHILRYDKNDGGYLVMDDDSEVPVATRKKDDLFRLFEMM